MKQKITFLIAIFVFAFGAQINAQNKSNIGKMAAPVSRAEPLKVGEIAPDFTLSSTAGKQITLSKVREPVVLVFYRGYW